MTIETVAVAAGAKWLWDSYGKDVSDKALGKIKEKWEEFKWQDAEETYRVKLREICSTVRVLGNPKPIDLDEIYTDVYVVDKPTAFRRFDIKELQARSTDFDTLQTSTEKRKPALNLALRNKRLFILGKPGAGKTTFLKYLVLKTIDGQFPKTPIFISLREWADSKLELFDFIVEQFEICSFPDSKTFVLQLLTKGNALVLFDGLDEVNIESNQRLQMIGVLTNFAKRYQNIHICLTCRIAATDYSFDQFTYLEIADFNKTQQDKFISKWYQDNKKNLERFQDEFEKSENQGLRDLARTPLLLTLLCLAFDETLSFPNRKVDLYKEAIDALLKKWDSSRGIRRDEIYRKLSPARKEQMLARIAAENFESGSYLVTQDKIEKQISQYLEQLPDSEGTCPDGDVILKAMEAQHGILVERAFGIYSFSHLTFQEYFTARYIVENAADGTLIRLIQSHLIDDRWREVFFLTSSLLDNGDNFFNIFLREIHSILPKKENLMHFTNWIVEKAKTNRLGEDAHRLLPSAVMLGLLLSNENNMLIRNSNYKDNEEKIEIQLNSYNQQIGFLFPIEPITSQLQVFFDYRFIVLFLERFSLRSKNVRRNFKKLNEIEMIKNKENLMYFSDRIGIKLSDNDFKIKLSLNKSNIIELIYCLKACGLFIDCLELAAVTERRKIENQLLSELVIS